MDLTGWLQNDIFDRPHSQNKSTCKKKTPDIPKA